MRWAVVLLAIPVALVDQAGAHPGMGAPTWNREISRIVLSRCSSCHRPEGGAFPLLTYLDAQPRANEIKEAVLTRRMPPWGAVKGFGDFRNDQSLSQEQIELIVRWVDSGIRRGNNPNQLPPSPKWAPSRPFSVPPGAVLVQGQARLATALTLDGLFVQRPGFVRFARITAELPDRSSVPLLWLSGYSAMFSHPFLLRAPVRLPAGTTIRGVPADMTLALIPRLSDK